MIRQPDGSFLADARASLEDVTAIVGAEFDVGEVANEVDTLAGYIATRIGRVPVRGELVPGPGRFEIEVLDADPRRVKKLKIYLSADRNGGEDAPRPCRLWTTGRAAPYTVTACVAARVAHHPRCVGEAVARRAIRRPRADRDAQRASPIRSCSPGDGGAC